ncbi:MAG: AAA family ATPase [Dysgonamonadaceae bacterium]|jgi:ATP-dependent metalloprotease FtsH|nr:AAA family ATPase [Dysgonamonadaceae bacterium]
MENLTESRSLSFVRMRAVSEAVNMLMEVYPEHLFLGLLKLSEITSDDIMQNSKYKEQTDADIRQVATRFKEAGIDSKQVRTKLRNVLLYDRPTGNAKALIEELFDKIRKKANGETMTAAGLLTVIMENPTPVLKGLLHINSPEEFDAQPKPPVPEAQGLAFLPELTNRIRKMRYTLLNKVHGQDHVVHAFAEGMFNAEVLAAADTERKRPRAIFVFAGPPGVGKTFLAEQAAEVLAIPFKRFDMSNFSDHQSQLNLIGLNPSYKEAKPGAITGFVKDNPHSILLFDEIEKAHLNSIQLFLQILDAGNLHDDFLDCDVSFRDTIIIFTTNAGRQLYEGDSHGNAAGLTRQTILNALETDTHPQTGKPFFPVAICSRIATGYPMMFNHLQSHHLEKIGKTELQRCCRLFEKQYGIKVDADELLATVLLFAEGGQTEARTLRAQTELFFKTELFKLFRLWESGFQEALERLESIKFSVLTTELPDDVKPVFNNPERQSILLFGNQSIAEQLRERLPDTDIYQAADTEEAIKLLTEKDIHLTLLELSAGSGETKKADPMATVAQSHVNMPKQIPTGTIGVFNFTPATASSLKSSRTFFRTVRERLPEMPVYLLESDAFVVDDELLTSFVRAGARGKLTLPGNDWSIFIEEIAGICNYSYLQNMATNLAMQRKVLSFETAPTLSPDKKQATIRIREFLLRRAVSAADTHEVLDDMEKPDTRFDDVIGASDAKNELQYFVNFLKDPKKTAASGYKPPKGVLLYGSPGTGKTMLARAMAGESDVAFIPATASSFVTKWQGSGPEAVRALFARARRYAPAIVFIDEIDAIGRIRGRGNTGHGEEMALNALLTEMDGFSVDPKRPVFVLAATNFNIEEGKSGIGTIDPALSRRFDRKILVELPNKEERERYLKLKLGKRPNGVTETMIQRIAERSTGYSLANLESVLELAFRKANQKEQALDDEILEEAFELNRHGEKKDWGKEYLERVARHESGHAYLCFLSGRTPAYLTIVARGDHGGYMEHSDDENSPLKTKEELLARIRTALGGRAAEIVYYGEKEGVSSGASGDLQSATRIARAMICAYGMDEEIGMAILSEEEATQGPLAEKINARITVIMREELARSIEMIKKGKPSIDKLVEKLMEKNKLTKEEMEDLMSNN